MGRLSRLPTRMPSTASVLPIGQERFQSFSRIRDRQRRHLMYREVISGLICRLGDSGLSDGINWWTNVPKLASVPSATIDCDGQCADSTEEGDDWPGEVPELEKNPRSAAAASNVPRGYTQAHMPIRSQWIIRGNESLDECTETRIGRVRMP